MNEHLMRAVLWAAVFFEASSDDECDSRHAVKQLEYIAHELRQLSQAEQDEFRQFARGEAERDSRPEMAALIPRLVDALLGDEHAT